MENKSLQTLIKKLREIDQNVDFARSHVQLEILLEMNEDNTTTITELAEKLGVNRRTIVDEIQKLKSKKLVSIKRKGEYVLTKNGIELKKNIKALKKINIYRAFQATRVLLILAISGTKELKIKEERKVYKEVRPIWLSLKEIADYTELPEPVVHSILDNELSDYVEKKVIDETIIDFKLNEQGLYIAEKIITELGYSLFTAKVFSIITGSSDLFIATRRYFTLYAILTLFTILTAPLYPWHLIPSILWLVITAYTAVLLAVSFKR